MTTQLEVRPDIITRGAFEVCLRVMCPDIDWTEDNQRRFLELGVSQADINRAVMRLVLMHREWRQVEGRPVCDCCNAVAFEFGARRSILSISPAADHASAVIQDVTATLKALGETWRDLSRP